MNYGIRIVPERTAFIIERFGKFNRVLDSGIHILIPLVCLVLLSSLQPSSRDCEHSCRDNLQCRECAKSFGQRLL